MLTFGVIGYGYWGPNLVRNLVAIKESAVKTVCDVNPQMLERVVEYYPGIAVTEHADKIMHDSEIDVVAIVTPVATHFKLAKQALENGKHVFIEKPFTFNVKQAEELISIAERNQLKIMVDHTFLFTGAVQRIKQEIDSGELGDIYYYDSTRVNLGLFQQDVNVIWDLAPHDFSIIDYILNKRVVSISAQGIDHFGRGIENIAYVTMYLEDNLIAHFNFNWLSPVKVRNTLIGGSRKMLVWDDLQRDEKIKIYDKGIAVDTQEGIYKSLIEYRLGDMTSPHVAHAEALKLELIHFIDCIEQNTTPMNDGHAGLRIVRMLEATDQSLKQSGKVVTI